MESPSFPTALHLDNRLEISCFYAYNRKRTKIKNNKIQCWRLKLASFSYTIKYRPGRDNVAADSLTRGVVLNQGSIEPLGFDEAVSGVRRERPVKDFFLKILPSLKLVPITNNKKNRLV